jgi:preprotein translocase subunit YajC
MVDVLLAAIVAIMVLFVFFLYLMIRRTVTEFKEGTRQDRGGG